MGTDSCLDYRKMFSRPRLRDEPGENCVNNGFDAEPDNTPEMSIARLRSISQAVTKSIIPIFILNETIRDARSARLSRTH